MKIQCTILYMNKGQPWQFKYEWGIFTQVSVGRLQPNLEQRCSG